MEKTLIWVGTSKSDLKIFHNDVIDEIGYALSEAQNGRLHPKAKPLVKGGFKGKGIFQITCDFSTNTYRCIYTVNFTKKIYVLDVFMKKSKSGTSTPKQTIDLVEQRYQAALNHSTQP